MGVFGLLQSLLRSVLIIAVVVFSPLLLAILLVGCQSNTTAPVPHKTITLSYWGGPDEANALEAAAHQFEQLHPMVHVNLMHIPENYFQKLHILAAAKQLPDVMQMNSLYLPVYAKGHVITPIKPQQGLVPASVLKTFYPQTLQVLSYNQQLYALPRDVSTLVVYVNTALLKQLKQPLPTPQWTITELKEMAQRIQQQSKVNVKQGANRVYTLSFFERPIYWLPFVWSFGGDVLCGNNPQQLCLTQPNGVQGIQTYANFRIQGQAPSPQQVGQTGMMQLFVQNQLVFLISGRWSIPFLNQNMKSEWAILPFPKGPNGKSVVGVDASGYALSASTHHPKEAALLMQYLTSASVLKQLANTGLIIPANQSVAQQTAQSKVFLGALQYGKPTVQLSSWDEFSEYLNQALEPAWDGKKSVKIALDEITPALKALIKAEKGITP